jgi:flagellar biosynthesis protein FlhF
MEMRTFEGVTLQDAIKSVKRAFGAEAVILSTREKSMPGSKSKVFEVTAAAPSDRRVGGAAVTRPDPRREMDSAAIEQLESRVTLLSDHVASSSQVKRIEAGLHEIKHLLMEGIRTNRGASVGELPHGSEGLYQQLSLTGVDAAYLIELFTHLKSLPQPARDSHENLAEYYKSQAIRWLAKRTKIAPQWTIVEGGAAVHVLVGPCGSGKTSVIAKIAARFITKQKSKVHLVTCDNRRLAASEQLRVVAKIVGATFSSIGSAQELEGAIAAASGADLILVDTAGTNPKTGIEELAQFRSIDVPVDIHLALSVTEKEAQMDRAVRAFSEIGLQSLIFNRLDESWSFGEIFNLSHRWSIPLSYFGTGQAVPDDLERASRERVIERLFGI